MQNELQANYPTLDIQILGVNSAGQQSGNASATADKDLPWLQDADLNSDGESDLWASWDITPRDVVILDAANKRVGVFNLTSHDLDIQENYDTLKEMLVSAATPASGAPWQNPDNHVDINDDGAVSPVGDVLAAINEINNRQISDGTGKLPVPPVPPVVPPPYYDVNGDGYITAVGDVLPVINYINNPPAGEGEAPAATAVNSAVPAANPAAALNGSNALSSSRISTVSRNPDDDGNTPDAAPRNRAVADPSIASRAQTLAGGKEWRADHELEPLLEVLAADQLLSDLGRP